MKKKMKLSLKGNRRFTDHLIQAILIFASVFLAFWLTEYRENVKSRKTLDISLHHIASEMSYNHSRIESAYRYYKSVMLQIDSIDYAEISNLESMYGADLGNWNGIQTPRLRSTAYSTFMNQGINNKADFELVNSLMGIYNLQSIIENIDKTVFHELALNDNFSVLPQVRHQFGIYLEILPQLMMVYQEKGKGLLNEYGYNMEIGNEQLKGEILKFK